MLEINAVVVPTLTPPPPGAELVLFSDPKQYVSEADAPLMLAAAARYAVHHAVTVVPERFVAANYLCMCIIDPQGKVLGVQRATHLHVNLRPCNFYRHDAITPIDTPFGKTALLVDVDVYRPLVARSAVEQGAEFLIAGQFVQPYDFYPDRIAQGVGNAAYSNGVAVIASVGIGGVLVGADGAFLCPYSENLPIGITVPADSQPDREGIETARRLLLSHRADILELFEGERGRRYATVQI